MQVYYKKTDDDDEVVAHISRKAEPHSPIWKIVEDYKRLLKPYDDSKKELLETLLSNNYNVRQILK